MGAAQALGTESTSRSHWNANEAVYSSAPVSLTFQPPANSNCFKPLGKVISFSRTTFGINNCPHLPPISLLLQSASGHLEASLVQIHWNSWKCSSLMLRIGHTQLFTLPISGFKQIFLQFHKHHNNFKFHSQEHTTVDYILGYPVKVCVCPTKIIIAA